MKDLSWLKTMHIAHRGLYTKDQKIPENSIQSFQLAMDSGYGIELDVNLTKDGKVVAFHDASLERICKDPRKLSNVDFDEIKSLQLFNSDQKIPLFSEVLKLVDGKVPLLIELKPKGDIIGLCKALMNDLVGYRGVYAVFSFHPKAVYWFKRNHPKVIRGQIAEYFRHDDIHPVAKHLLKHMFFNRFTHPDFVSYGIADMPNHILDRLLKKGMTIISYAAKTQEDLDRIRTSYHNAVFEHFIPRND